ncbi:unnamed protein product [Trichobilharzia regenti]|nr:unnamed protein product [Trichobilharzia regenti]
MQNWNFSRAVLTIVNIRNGSRKHCIDITYIDSNSKTLQCHTRNVIDSISSRMFELQRDELRVLFCLEVDKLAGRRDTGGEDRTSSEHKNDKSNEDQQQQQQHQQQAPKTGEI